MSRLPKAVALLSGGLDSSVATWLAQRSHDVALALTFDYGQQAAPRELAQAEALAQEMGIVHRSLSLPWFTHFQSGGALLGGDAPPAPTDLNDLEEGEANANAVWVPNRNGVFLEIAAGFAEDLGAEAVIVGFNREEAATFPDNSQAYIEAISAALCYSAGGVKVISPTAGWDKTEIVAHAKQADFPFSKIWSCYQNGDTMCGQCESCSRLQRALNANHIPEVPFANPRSF